MTTACAGIFFEATTYGVFAYLVTNVSCLAEKSSTNFHNLIRKKISAGYSIQRYNLKSMIISQQKKFADILKSVKEVSKIFLVGCGECATTCKSGGEPEVLELKKQLEASGKTVTGYAIPKAPCVAAQIKTALAQNMNALRNSEAIWF